MEHSYITNTCKLAKQKLELLYRQLSADWPENTITPVFKSWAESSVSNYRPISLLYTHSKLLEHIVVGSCTISSQTSSSPPDIMDSDQAAQPRRYSYNWNLDHSLTLAALFLDMSRAFDKIPHLHLLHSLSAVSTQGHYSNGWRDTFPIVPKKSSSTATPSCSFWCPTRVHSGPSGIHHLHQLPGWTPLLPRDICHVLCKWHFTVTDTSVQAIWLNHLPARCGSSIWLDHSWSSVRQRAHSWLSPGVIPNLSYHVPAAGQP